jgi:hypothetical protein
MNQIIPDFVEVMWPHTPRRLTSSTAWTLRWFLGAIPKLRNARIGFVMSARAEHIGRHLTDVHEVRYFIIMPNSVEKIQRSSKSDKNNGYFA